jgi:hypothetical protein
MKTPSRSLRHSSPSEWRSKMQSVTLESEPRLAERPDTIDRRMALFRKLEAAVVEAADRTAAPIELAKAAKFVAIRWLFGVSEWVIKPPDLYHFALRALAEERRRWKSIPNAPKDARRAEDERPFPAPSGCCYPCALNRIARALRELKPIELYSHYLHQQGLDDDDAALVLHTAPVVVQLFRQRARKALEHCFETLYEVPPLPNQVGSEDHSQASE